MAASNVIEKCGYFKKRTTDIFDFSVNNKLQQFPSLLWKCETDVVSLHKKFDMTERWESSFKRDLHCETSNFSLSYVSQTENSDTTEACSVKDIGIDGLYEEFDIVEAGLSFSELKVSHSEEWHLRCLFYFFKEDVKLGNLRKVSGYMCFAS